MKYALPLVGATVLSALLAGTASAQESAQQDRTFVEAAEQEDQQYGQSYEYQPNPQAIIHQKAQARGRQRMARMAAMKWYGMSNGRPTASPTPFTALYSPAWQMSGGRPYAWYHNGWASSSIVIQR